MREQTTAWTETAARLWASTTAPTVVQHPRRRTSERGLREFLFLPNAERPRVLLPAGTPQAAASALRRYSHAVGWRERVERHLLATALRTSFPERLLRDRLHLTVPYPDQPDAGSVEAFLSGVLGQEPYLSLRLGNARANRKPVLHALSPTGESLAFVKVGDTDVARGLVRAEARALRHLDSRSWAHFTPPRVLHTDTWGDLEVLVISPLVTTARRWKARHTLPITAMRELATADGLDRQPLADSPFWERRAAVPAQLHAEYEARRLSSILDRVAASYGDTPVEMGAWHGDWTPWNMAWWREKVQLWDWERFDHGVPYGFDLLHYQLQDRLRARGLHLSAIEPWLASAAHALGPLGVTGRPARATVAAYLLELCCRYLLAAQEPTGEALRTRAQWLLSFVYENAGRL